MKSQELSNKFKKLISQMRLDLTILILSKETNMKNWRKKMQIYRMKLTKIEMSWKKLLLDLLKLKLDWNKIILSKELNI